MPITALMSAAGHVAIAGAQDDLLTLTCSVFPWSSASTSAHYGALLAG